MYQHSGLMFLYSQTAIQAGAGGGAGVIDMPVQREAVTYFPMIAGGGVRGAVRQKLEKNTQYEHVRTIFGSKLQDDKGQQSGSIAFSDAKILLFPIVQPKGVFVWVTCPLALRRVMCDSNTFAKQEIDAIIKLEIPKEKFITVATGIYDQETIVLGHEILQRAEKKTYQEGQSILSTVLKSLLPLVFPNRPEQGKWKSLAQKFYNEQNGQSAVIIVADKVFSDLVCKYTQIESRICIDNTTHMAQSGALWREETLPPEMLMYSVVLSAPLCLQYQTVAEKLGNSKDAKSVHRWLKTSLKDKYLQIGAGETMGRGYFAVSCGW